MAQAKAQQAAVSNRLAAKLAKASANGEAATSDQEAPDMGSFFSKMMQDPDTKKLIQETQRTMMEQMYAPLIKKLGLTPVRWSAHPPAAVGFQAQGTGSFRGRGRGCRICHSRYATTTMKPLARGGSAGRLHTVAE